MKELLTSYGELYSSQQSISLLNTLFEKINWQQEFVAFGRCFSVPRLQAWYADEGVHYRYSDNKLNSNVWIEPLLSVKQDIETSTGYRFNSVLLTYYRNGDDHVNWHADDEPELGESPVIASLSLGGSRKFNYREKQLKSTSPVELEFGSMDLHNGELLVMQSEFQQYWEHRIPQQPDIVKPRLNLTFRKVIMQVN